MDDHDCIRIQSKAIAHLINCAFDDFQLSASELANEINTNLTGVVARFW